MNRDLLKLLTGLFLQAETDIVNEIGRLRSRGLTDYHAEAALERVQAILRKLENDCWKYVPQMVERQFYVHHPEARKTLEFPETAEKHRRGYLNAYVLTGEQTDIVNRLVMNLMGEVVEGDLTVYATLERALLGRRENDRFRPAGLSQTALAQAKGQGLFRAVPGFVEALRRDGVTAFIDRAGRRWSLHTYGSMVLRTTSRQAEVLSVLTRDPEQDLYKISRHGTTCKLCAPLEGRVYSKSGADPDFPPLSAALGEPFWNIHPNCLHQLTPWTPMGRSPEEIRNIKEFSSLQKNPVTRDPRTQAQIKAYRTKERDRAKWLADYRQWENYRTALGDRAPKTFQTFLRHKRAGDEKYKGWLAAYRKRGTGFSGQSVHNETAPPGIPVQVGAVNFADKKAVLAQLARAERETVGLSYEVSHTVTQDGKVWRVSGDGGAVNPSAIPSSLAGSYSYHNHPKAKTWFSFSAADVRFFFQSDAAYSSASDYLYKYSMQRNPETLAVRPDVVYHRFKEIYQTDIYELSDAGEIDIDLDGFHETMRRLSREYGFVYERRKRDACE